MFIVGVIVLFMVYLVSRSINWIYIRFINEVIYVILFLVDGYYYVCVLESNVKEIRVLFVIINDLVWWL